MITEAEKQEVIDAGYSVKENEGMNDTPWFWALNPTGYSIVRGPCYTEDEAWAICKRDYENHLK